MCGKALTVVKRELFKIDGVSAITVIGLCIVLTRNFRVFERNMSRSALLQTSDAIDDKSQWNYQFPSIYLPTAEERQIFAWLFAISVLHPSSHTPTWILRSAILKQMWTNANKEEFKLVGTWFAQFMLVLVLFFCVYWKCNRKELYSIFAFIFNFRTQIHTHTHRETEIFPVNSNAFSCHQFQI